MKVSVGVEHASRPAKKSTLAASIGAELPMAQQRAMRKAQMLAAVGGGAPLSTGVAGPMGPTKGGCDASGCEEPIDPRVLRSVMLAQQGTPLSKPAGAEFSDNQWNAIVGMINATKYCPSPRRVGWQQSSMTFASLAVPDGNTVTVTLTPGQAFCMNALVAANGSALDVRFTIDSILYLGVEYVTNGPWLSLFYTSSAACCLCVRELPIIDPNSSVVMTMTNGAGEAADLFVQVFGEELFC